MTGRRARIGAGAAVFLLCLAGAVGVVRTRGRNSDFRGFHEGARTLREEGRLSWACRRYPPTFLALIAPLGLLPVGAAAALWNGASVLAAIALGRWALAHAGGRAGATSALAAALPFALDNLLLGQSGLLLLAGGAGAVALACRRHPAAAGALVAVLTGAKLLPLVYLAPAAVFGRRGRLLAGFAAGAALAAAATVLVFGTPAAGSGGRRFLDQMRLEGRAERFLEQPGNARLNNGSVAAVLARWTIGLDGHRLRLAGPAGERALRRVGLASRAIALAALAAFLAAALRPGRRAEDLFALSALVPLLVSPLVWTHYFVALGPALVRAGWSRRAGWLVAGASTVALAVPAARWGGFHLALAALLFGLLWRRIMRAAAEPAAPAPG